MQMVCQLNVIDVYEINHIRTAEMKLNEEWSLQLWTQFMQLCKKQLYRQLTIELQLRVKDQTFIAF